MVTPLSEGGARLRLDIIPQHLSYLEHRGADGVLALGTNGEGPSLSLEERRDVIDAVITHRGRMRVIAGTGCAALPDTIALTRYAIERGADAVMVVPPFYFKDVADDGLLAYYDALLRALPPERKLLLYNIPSVSGIEITEPLVDALLERFPERLLGLKDTSGDAGRTRRYVERNPQLAIYNGSDENLAQAIDAGVVGSISAVANVFPDLLAWVYRAHESGGDVAGAQADLTRVKEILFRYPSHGAVKRALQLVAGLPLTYVRPPLRDLTPDEAASLERELGALEIG
jgi:4-hydroxy-tetrahydrodipicolinate synthase